MSGNEGVYMDGKTLAVGTDGDVIIQSSLVSVGIHLPAQNHCKMIWAHYYPSYNYMYN